MKNAFLKHFLILLYLCYPNSYGQKSSFIVTEANDTINVERFTIKTDKIKAKLEGNWSQYTYDEVKSLYNAKEQKHFQKIAPAFVEYSKSSGTVFFAHRLTDGKVKIYNAILNNPYYGGKLINNNYSSFYIGIYDAKPELICHEWDLKLTKDVYKLLKLYLHSNDEIQKKLDDLFFSKEDENEKTAKIIDLVTEYNTWVAATK
jgi:hypothetical protein